MMSDQAISKEEAIDYQHMCRISDSSAVTLLEDYFSDWHAENARLDPSFLRKKYGVFLKNTP